MMKWSGLPLRLAALWLAPVVNAAPLAGSNIPIPFIQRISVADFQAVESRLGHALSKSCTLVIYRPEGLDRWTAIGLGTSADGARELIKVHGETTGEESEPRISETRVVLQPEIVAQIERSLRFILERNVYPVGDRTWKTSPYDRDWWILLRVTRVDAIAGIALQNAVHNHPSDFAIVFTDILRGLHAVVEAPSNEREIPLLALDKLTGRFVLLQKAGLKP